MKMIVIPLMVICNLSTVSCQERLVNIENKYLVNALQEYYKYLDSLNVSKEYHYIIIDATKKHDTTELIIYYYGGSYPFFNNGGKFIDFINYNGYDLMLLGDYPNPVINVTYNKKLSILNDIIKKKFPNEYKYYYSGNYVAEPLICEYMELSLVFKSNKLIRKCRGY